MQLGKVRSFDPTSAPFTPNAVILRNFCLEAHHAREPVQALSAHS
jgi:hypothetical protein